MTSKIKKYTIQEISSMNLNEVKQLCEKLKIRKYIQYGSKLAMAESVIETLYKYGDGYVLLDSPGVYIMYHISLAAMYAENLDIYIADKNSARDIYTSYDVLKSSGILDEIIKKAGKDIEEYMTIFNMVNSDYLENNSGVKAFLSFQIRKLFSIFGGANADLNK